MSKSVLFLVVLIANTVAVVTVADGQKTEHEQPQLLSNGDFSEWKDDLPVNWTVAIGASSGGNSPASTVRKADTPGVELSGNRNTLAWRTLTQRVAVKPGSIYELSFKAKTAGLKRERNQYDNCYVGMWFLDRDNKLISTALESPDCDAFHSHRIISTVPKNATQINVTIFLSKTGQLHVKNVRLNEVELTDFEFLVESLRDKYSYLDHKQIDLDSLANKYRQAAESASSKEDFVEVIADMLAELRDVHTWVGKDGKPYSKFTSTFDANYNFQVVDADLKSAVRIGKHAVIGRNESGIGYLRITSLNGFTPNDVRRIQKAIAGLFDAPGIIVDLRRNGGGSEPLAQNIAALFTDRTTVYAQQKVRSGKGFGKVRQRFLNPLGISNGTKSANKAYTKPVICLIGPGAVSSAEGFALMMKSLNHCQTVGQPTRGASGNPAAVTLPNGVQVWFSRWMAMNADGDVIEDRGVFPDVMVKDKPTAKTDPAYATAVKMLTE